MRSIMACPKPCAAPPSNCPRANTGLMMWPASSTQTRRSIRGSPVSASTAMRAITHPWLQASAAVKRDWAVRGRASPPCLRLRASRQACAMALPPIAVLRLASAPMPAGQVSVSPSNTSTACAWQPSSVAAIWAKVLAWPCPWSGEPLATVTRPSACRVTRADSQPWPQGSRYIATPMPTHSPAARRAA